MKVARWLDHLPLWIVFGAVARTGIFEPWEWIFMAIPLLFAALVESLRRDLTRWRLPLELLILAWLAFDFLTHPGFFGALVRLLFLLSGLRLALPRQVTQRRQLLLMGFLLFLTTAISNANLEFFLWALAWMIAATLALLQLAWEPPASLRPGPAARPPYRLVFGWAGSGLLLAAAFFLLLPRINSGWRPFPSFGTALGRLQAGLSDQVDLSQSGPISANHTVVMRVVPPPGLSETAQESLGQSLAYFKGITLEQVQGQKWEPYDLTPVPSLQLEGQQNTGADVSGTHLELFLEPSPRGLVPLPYDTAFVSTPFIQRLRRGEGGSWHLPFPVTRGIPLQVVQAEPTNPTPQDPWQPEGDEPPPFGKRLALLLEVQPQQDVARRTSLAWVPEARSAPALATRLSAHLRTFRYTLDNPCATAANPLEDFLEHTQAGHCEYFASALALMLRTRGVPARVINGYRLGAWVPEGGYWLVTQDEAHSWVEYWDGEARKWRMADGTPSIAVNAGQGLWNTWTRLADALAFRWDRYVVRFSGEDQSTGFSSVQGWAQNLAKEWHWSWKRPSPWASISIGLILLLWIGLRFRPSRPTGGLAEPKGSRVLAPLLRKTRRMAPPTSGETAQAWLGRLAKLRPDRKEALANLSLAVDQAFYGSGSEAPLKPLVKREAKAWK